MVSGGLAGEGLQTGFSRHGLPPQRAPLDTVYPLREHLNSVQRMVSGGYCEGLFPDTVCWTRRPLRISHRHFSKSFSCPKFPQTIFSSRDSICRGSHANLFAMTISKCCLNRSVETFSIFVCDLKSRSRLGSSSRGGVFGGGGGLAMVESPSAIGSKMLSSSKSSLATTDFLARKNAASQLMRNLPSWNPCPTYQLGPFSFPPENPPKSPKWGPQNEFPGITRNSRVSVEILQKPWISRNFPISRPIPISDFGVPIFSVLGGNEVDMLGSADPFHRVLQGAPPRGR